MSSEDGGARVQANDEEDVEGEEQSVPRDDEPCDPVEVPHVVVVEEPELPEHERAAEQTDRGEPASPGHDQHERDQPDEVLRRHEAVEDEKRGDSRRCCEHESLCARRPAHEEEPDKRDGHELKSRERLREHVGQRARQIARHRSGRALHDGRVVEAEPVRGEQERAAEALDLKPTGRLRVKAVPETARRDCSEGQDDEQHDAGQHGCRFERAAPSRRGPHVDERRRHDHERVELRAHGQPQEPERQQVPPAQQRSEGSRGQRRRPEVVGVQGDRPDHERGEREQHSRSVEPAPSHAQAQQRQRDGKERAEPAERHQALEGEVVVPCRKRPGRQEDGKRSRRIFDEEVAVGQLAPEELVCVDAVEMDVAVPLAAEEASVGDCAGR